MRFLGFIVDAWRRLLHCFIVPKDHDKHRNETAGAIRELACAIVESAKAAIDGLVGLATKKDLSDAEARLSALITAGGHPPRVRFEWAVGLVQNKARNETHPMDIKITNEQQVRVTLSPKTDTGKPAKLDGSPSWTTVSGNSQVVVADDGLSALLVSSDDPGDTEVLVKADADLGEGVEEISEILKLSVVGATAKNLGITVGTPEAKPTV